MTVPPDWIVTARDRYLALTDATNEASFEISPQPLPLDPLLPGVRERLERVLAVSSAGAECGPVTVIDRGDAEIARAEHPHEAVDPKSGEKRLALARMLVAANNVLQVLATFVYRPADAAWAVPEWRRIVSSLRLAGA